MFNRRAVVLTACFLLFSSLVFSQTLTGPLAIAPADRIVGKIDDSQTIALQNSRHPLAVPANSLGAVPGDQPMERMVLVLRPSVAQEAALEELLRAQQDPASPSYHQWLTPEVFGQRFGVSQNDLSRIVIWLHSHGMSVEEIPASRRTIVFSGDAAQAQETFHTSIERYVVKGEVHFANASDSQIPAALAPVVDGIVSLHDFKSASQLVAPTYTLGNGVHFLEPEDWDVIYDVNPLFRQGLDGTGQSIAVLGRVDVALSDIRVFRSNAGLPPNDPQIIVNGVDPGFPNCNDEVEAALDVEWAGAIARNATVKFVTSKSGASDGINLSAQYAVNHNVAPIISLSYGLCEAAYSSSGNAFWNSLWQQAAAQGISVFVSSGDSGAAGCDPMSATTATHGRGVNALCSSPYSTCVGGTQFNDVYNSGQYWSDSNSSNGSSVFSYIPEVAWNESGWSNALFASSGGASKIYPKPVWQAVPGVPADGMRDVPDISVSAAIHDAYIIQIQGQTFYVAGTSAATPSLASVMALVNENQDAAQGNVNPKLYTLANLQLSASGAPVFHDITSGNNSVPGVTGFSAGTGYDLVTGLGSVDANLLVNHWSDSVSSSFTLSPSPAALSLAAGASGTATVTETVQNGFGSAVKLSVSGAPAGVTITFTPSNLSAAGSSSMKVATASTTVPGTYAVTVTGTGGGLSRTASVSLTISSPPTVSVTSAVAGLTIPTGTSASTTITTLAQSGFKSAVTLSVTGLPKGMTAVFTPTTIASPGSGSSTLTLTAAAGAVAGTYPLNVIASGGSKTAKLPLSITVIVPNFTLAAGATVATASASAPAQVALSTSIVNGFKSAISLSVAGLPKGVSAAFSPASIVSPGSGSSTLKLTVASGATSGTYVLTITATGGGVTQRQSLSLTVIAPSFGLALSSSAVSMRAGAAVPLTVTTTVDNGFNSAVALTISTLPKGVIATFANSKLAAPGAGSTALTITAVTATGTYNLTITAAGGGLTQTQQLALTLYPLTPRKRN